MPNINDLNPYLTITDVNEGDILVVLDEGKIIKKDFSRNQDGSDTREVLGGLVSDWGPGQQGRRWVFVVHGTER